jgi:hypothetical protein
VSTNYPYYVGRRATVHWCPANESHRLHVICGARRGPGWYVFLLDGCLGRIVGVFESEEAAMDFAAEAVEGDA